MAACLGNTCESMGTAGRPYNKVAHLLSQCPVRSLFRSGDFVRPTALSFTFDSCRHSHRLALRALLVSFVHLFCVYRPSDSVRAPVGGFVLPVLPSLWSFILHVTLVCTIDFVCL